MEAIWRLRRIGIRSAMKIGCVLSCAIGFIIGTIWGIIFGFFSSMIAVLLDRPAPGVGVATVIIMPFFVTVVYYVLGTLLSFLLALLYNLAAGVLGGIEFEMGFESKPDTGYLNYEL